MIILTIFIFGALIGSFLNVCISRIPQNTSIVLPRSSCPNCHTPVKSYHNIPIVSYIMLRGRCAFCNSPIPTRYLSVELLTASLLALIYYQFGFSQSFFTHATLLFFLVVITFIDIEHQLILNKITFPGIVIGFIMMSIRQSGFPMDAVYGFFLGGGILMLIAVIGNFIFKKESMGGGDIKLMAMIGCFLGFKGVLVTLFYAFISGALIGIVARFMHKDYLPFAPFISTGAFLYLITNDSIFQLFTF